MKKVKLFEIMNARAAIDSSGILKREGIDHLLSYKLMKFVKFTSDDEKFFNEKRNEIAKKYAEIGPDGKYVSDHSGHLVFKSKNDEEVANKENFDLNNIEVDAPIITFDLIEFNGLGMSPAFMMGLDPFINDPFVANANNDQSPIDEKK